MAEERPTGEQLTGLHQVVDIDGYLPLDRRLALTNECDIIPCQWGILLFADCVDFTKITSSFSAEQGKQHGAEKLAFYLNKIYGPLIDLVYQFHGEVMDFAGDSLDCWFPGDDGLLALNVALEMQRLMSDSNIILPLKDKLTKLELKISLASGIGHRYLVGDPDIQNIEVLAGVQLNKAFIANKLAKPGEIIVTRQISQSLGNQLLIKEWREDFQLDSYGVVAGINSQATPREWPRVKKVPAELIKNWILEPIYKRLLSGQDEYLAELRWSVPVFVKFGEINFDSDEIALQKLDAFVRYVQRILARYGGFLIQLIPGEKGSYIYAVFGPLISHENDIVRAVSAAADILHQSENLPFVPSIQIGISSGLLYAGVYGNVNRRFYSVCGEETNIAARLMERALPGQILVSNRVKNVAEAEFDFTELNETVHLKGIAQPIPVFALVHRHKFFEKKYTPHKKLIGRVNERSLLIHKLNQLEEGKSAIVVLEGEAGIGKSALLEMLQDSAAEMALPCLAAAGDDIEQSTIYYAWRSIFASVIGGEQFINFPDERKTYLEGFLRFLDEVSLSNGLSLESDLALLSAILPIDFPDTPQTAAMPAQVRAEATRNLLLRVLDSSFHNRPLLLIFDDVQWLDSASWALLLSVVTQKRPLYLAMATRPAPDQSQKELHELSEREDSRFIKLTSMDNQDITSLIAQRLGVSEIPHVAASFILERADGNPFFSEEITNALLDSNILAVENGGCQVKSGAQLSQLDFPVTIQELITCRIDRLTPQQQLVLKVASVIGRTFTAQSLREMLPDTAIVSELSSHLEALTALDFMWVDPSSDEPQYVFKHITTQQVAYNLLLQAQRRELHRKIAEQYERKLAGELSSNYPLLAYHWLKAVEGSEGSALHLDTILKAMELAQHAGLQAIRNNAHEEAISILSNALTVLKSFPAREQLLLQELNLEVLFAIPLTLTGGWASRQVGEAYQRANELCNQIGKTPQLFPTLVGVFTYYLVRAQYQQAAALAKENLALARRTNDAALIMEAEHDQGAVLFYTGHFPAAELHFKECIRLYDGGQHYPHVFTFGKNAGVTARVHLALIQSIMGYADQGDKTINESIELAVQFHHPFSYLWALSGRMVTYQLYNQTKKMVLVVQDMIHLSREQGFPNWLAQGLTWLGWIQAYEGQKEMAIQNMQQGVAIWQMTGSELLQPYFMYLLADGYARTGQPEKALATLKPILAKTEENGEMWFTAEILRLLGQLYLWQDDGDLNTAESFLLKGLALAGQQKAGLHELRLSATLAQLRHMQGRKQEAYQLLVPKLDSFSEGHTTPVWGEITSILDHFK